MLRYPKVNMAQDEMIPVCRTARAAAIRIAFDLEHDYHYK